LSRFLYFIPHALHKVFGPSGPARHSGEEDVPHSLQPSRGEGLRDFPFLLVPKKVKGRTAGKSSDSLRVDF